MLCSKCGTACADEAAFCYKCGKALPTMIHGEPTDPPSVINHAPPTDAGGAFTEQPRSTPIPPKPLDTDAKSTNRRTWLSVGAVTFLSLMYFMIIDSALSGANYYTKAQDQIQFMLIGGLFFWFIFRSHGRNK